MKNSVQLILSILLLLNLSFLSAQNVGINTTNPQTALHVADDNIATGGVTIGTGTVDDGGNLRLLSTFNHWNLDNTGGALRFFTETGFGSGGLEWFRIDSAGKVGIGTSSPGNPLSVNGNADFTGRIGIGTNSPHTNFQTEIFGTTAWGGGILARGSTAGVVLGEHSGVAQIGGHNASGTTWADLIINSGGGNVGIGTTSPSNPLSVSGNADFTGNVGIGTATPAAALDVHGDVRLGNTGQFFAVGGEENLRIIRGRVDASGAILAGCCFTVQLLSTGQFRITPNSPFSGSLSATANANTDAATNLVEVTYGVTGFPANHNFDVWIREFVFGNRVNAPFSFIAMGPK